MQITPQISNAIFLLSIALLGLAAILFRRRMLIRGVPISAWLARLRDDLAVRWSAARGGPSPTGTAARSRAMALTGAALALAGAGEWAMLDYTQSLLQGLLFFLAAIACFILGVREAGIADPGLEPAPVPPPILNRFGFWATSIVLMYALWVLVPLTSASLPLGWATLALWLVTIGLFSVSVLRAYGFVWPTWPKFKAWVVEYRLDILIVAAIGGFAFLLRFYNLELIPYPFINDEGEVGKEALRMAAGQRWDFFYIAWASQPAIAFLPAGLLVKLFGNTALALRLVSAIEGTLTVVLVCLFGRELFDRKVGWYAGLLLAALPNHIHFSRLAVDNVVDALTSTVALYFLFRGIKRASAGDYLLAGIATGLTLCTYPGSRLVIGLVLGTVIYAALRHREYLRTQFSLLAVMVAAALLAATPAISSYNQNPNEFVARLKQEGILFNGVLDTSMQNAQMSKSAFLLDQFERSALVYVAEPANGGFFDFPYPYLIPLAAIIFVLGLGFVMWGIQDLRLAALTAWFWAAIILGSTLTGGPPTSQRMLMSAPPLALITALGLRLLERVAEANLPAARRQLSVLALVIVAGICFNSASLYFKDYLAGHFFEDRASEIPYEARVDLAPLGSQYRVYMIGRQLFYAGFASFDYFAPGVEKTDFNDVTPSSIAALPRDKGAFFLTFTERVSELRQIAQWIPGGEWIERPRRDQDGTLYYAYKVSAAQMQKLGP